MLQELLQLIHRTRQHHAIEHATLHVIQRTGSRYLSGYSDPFGFTLFGDTDLDNVRRAVGNALLRLQAGEDTLAIHPNCGTNLVTTGVLVTAAAFLAGRKRNPLERFTLTLLWVLPMIVAGKALGMYLQRYTTEANVSDRWVAEIFPVNFGNVRAYRVIFE
ncbi:MAG: DUF6391 domain-containing protein [Caldilineaceae bacterium]